MPYNTRRKSLSLPSLGIHLPNSSRAHRSPPSKLPNTTAETAPQPPPKKIKRSHPSAALSPASSSKPSSSAETPESPEHVSIPDLAKGSGRRGYEHTPPPSPGATSDAKVDTEGINDDIVTGVIRQLERTGNRPHLVKELAAVLGTSVESVAGSVATPPTSHGIFGQLTDVFV